MDNYDGVMDGKNKCNYTNHLISRKYQLLHA